MIKIKVPATSANLGPGFDSMGMALTKYNYFYVEELEYGLVIDGCPKEFRNEDNLFYVSLNLALNELQKNIKGVKIIFDSTVPLKGGLGSSATCIIGGILAAFALTNTPIDNDKVLSIALKLENHPDNITPALLGGITVSVIEGGKIYTEKFTTPDNIQYIALTPNMELSTEESRNILPKEISLKDGVFNTSHAALLALSLSRGNIDNIKISCKDTFHQNHRGKLIPDFFNILKFTEDNGAVATFLSGAGPTIMIINEKENHILVDKLQIYLSSCDLKWTISVLSLDNNGATVSLANL